MVACRSSVEWARPDTLRRTTRRRVYHFSIYIPLVLAVYTKTYFNRMNYVKSRSAPIGKVVINMETCLDYGRLSRIQKKLQKAYCLMINAHREFRRLSRDRDRLAYRRRQRDRSYREKDARRAQSAERRRTLAYETYLKRTSQYEAMRAMYWNATYEIRQKLRPIAQAGGIPEQYLDYFHAALKKDGDVYFYFGGEGYPRGNGHATVVLGAHGELKFVNKPRVPVREDSRMASVA